MNHRLVILICSVWLVVFGGSAGTTNRLSLLAQLPDGDKIEIKFTSTGCLHSVTQTIILSEPTLFASVSHPSAQVQSPISTARMMAVNPGSLLLTPADLTQLDRLVAFYRTNQVSGCTTTDRITLIQSREGRIVASESFEDSSCRAERLSDALTIDELLRRVMAASERASTSRRNAAPAPSDSQAGLTWLPVFGEAGPEKIRVVVDGSVNRPGIYHLAKDSTVRDALGVAQDLYRYAQWGRSSLSRLDSQRVFESIEFRREHMQEDLQIRLKDGDWIHIAEVHGE